MKRGEIQRVFSLSKTVRKEAKELDRLGGGALAAFWGASIVIGGIGGSFWWVLTAMATFLALYRFSKNYLPFFKRANIADFDDLIDNLEKVEHSSLPNKVKEKLNVNLLSQLPSASLNKIKQLEFVESNNK